MHPVDILRVQKVQNYEIHFSYQKGDIISHKVEDRKWLNMCNCLKVSKLLHKIIIGKAVSIFSK